MFAQSQSLARGAATAYLAVQAAALVAYWGTLIAAPGYRAHFVSQGSSSDSALMAFVVADLGLYFPLSVMGAVGLWRRASWAWPVLWAHAGASVYPTLYAITLWMLEPARWLGALMMAPALVVSPTLVWMFRPRAA